MKTNNERLSAQMEDDFVVFLIGMRINRIWKFWKWLPIFVAMPGMLKELASNPGSGFLSGDAWFGRTIILVQYWKSTDDLIRYAHDKDSKHLPAWRRFNRAIGKSGDVGIFHETYPIAKEGFEVIYANMPAFGLGRAGTLVAAEGKMQGAKSRLAAS